MLVVESCDVNVSSEGGAKRLRKAAEPCENHGQRAQFSVFECLVDPVQWSELKFQLEETIDHNKDCLRYYYLGSNWQRSGAKKPYNPEGLLLL